MIISETFRKIEGGSMRGKGILLKEKGICVHIQCYSHYDMSQQKFITDKFSKNIS